MQIRRFRLPVLALLVLLSGCYLPARFAAEIEISRNGFYKMDFEGYVVDATFYRDLRDKKLTQKQINERIDAILTDFQRDSATKHVSYYGQGAFKVKWVDSGDLLRARMVTFVRRNEEMLSIAYLKDKNVIRVHGRALSKDQKDRLAQMGLNMEGELTVRTDAKVIQHNATKVERKGTVGVYTWTIKSLYDPTPNMVLALR
jgi:hypothetical protein